MTDQLIDVSALEAIAAQLGISVEEAKARLAAPTLSAPVVRDDVDDFLKK